MLVSPTARDAPFPTRTPHTGRPSLSHKTCWLLPKPHLEPSFSRFLSPSNSIWPLYPPLRTRCLQTTLSLVPVLKILCVKARSTTKSILKHIRTKGDEALQENAVLQGRRRPQRSMKPETSKEERSSQLIFPCHCPDPRAK